MRISRTIVSVLAAACLVAPVARAGSVNLLDNPGFEQVGPLGPLTWAQGPPGGRAAAADWFIFNNTLAITFSGLVPSTLPGGQREMMGVSTATANNGVADDFLPPNTGPTSTLDSVWVYVVAGCVGMGVGNSGTQINEDASTCSLNRWIDLRARNGVSPANEIIIYAANAGATFFIDNASVTDPPPASSVPEPSTCVLFGMGLATLMAVAVADARRRPAVIAYLKGPTLSPGTPRHLQKHGHANAGMSNGTAR